MILHIQILLFCYRVSTYLSDSICFAQVKDELYNKRKAVMKISGDNMCSLCNKKIGTSVFAVYPNGKTLVHFVCFRDSQSMKAVAQGTPFKKPF